MAGLESASGFEYLESVLGSDSTLLGYAPGGVWRGMAEDNTATPYVVIALQSGSDQLTATGVRVMTDAQYLIKAFGPAKNTMAIANAAWRIDQLLRLTSGVIGTPGTALAAYILSAYRETALSVDEIVNGELWTNIGGLYRLLIQGN